MLYEAVWYNGWIYPPAYVLLDEVEGDTPQQALQNNLAHLTQRVREIYSIEPEEWRDEKIQDTLYILKNDTKVSVDSLWRSGLM